MGPLIYLSRVPQHGHFPHPNLLAVLFLGRYVTYRHFHPMDQYGLAQSARQICTWALPSPTATCCIIMWTRRPLWSKHFAKAYLYPSLHSHSISNHLSSMRSHSTTTSMLSSHNAWPVIPITSCQTLLPYCTTFMLQNYCPHLLAQWSTDVSPTF
jgi:hypothetical protein